MNSLPFTNGGPFAVTSYSGPQQTANGNQTQANGTQAGTQPFSAQPVSGQMSTSGFTSGQQIPGSGLTSGQMSAAGFVSGNPMPDAGQTGSNPAGYMGTNMNPFSSQQTNSSMNMAGYPSTMNSMAGNIAGAQNSFTPGMFDPTQMLGRSKFYVKGHLILSNHVISVNRRNDRLQLTIISLIPENGN